MKVYDSKTKVLSTKELLDIEKIIDEVLEVLTRHSTDLNQPRTIDRLRSRITDLRYKIDSASLLIYPETSKDELEIIEIMSYFYLL